MSFKCPDCGKQLQKVTRSAGSPLNAEQFDAVRAGDWYCDACPGNGRGNTNLRYFWDREVLHTCDHPDFSAAVDIHRLEAGRFQAHVRIRCAICGKAFRFIGLPAGLDLNGAATSPDATEARLAIAPEGEVVSLVDGAPVGFSIRKM